MVEHYEFYNKPPTSTSGFCAVLGMDWKIVDYALIHGRFHLPKNLSLEKLSVELGFTNNKKNKKTSHINSFSVKIEILKFHKKHGKLPSGNSGYCEGLQVAWAYLDTCLRKGYYGFSLNSSLAKLKVEMKEDWKKKKKKKTESKKKKTTPTHM